ncbi:MAG: T9SS type A sorting domain-containing protein, partial [Chitinophagaceae bacterium]|nr:T9SS type A sorting domain-containing protein [Chitinophagaceae bacterium]
QWKVNGFIVGTNSATYSTSTLANGDVVTCTFTSSLACVTTASVNSNSITMTVSPLVTPTISIVESVNNVCAGTSITFTSIITNGGSSPSYQWKVNNVNVGTNSTSYTTSSLLNGDIVTCVMTSNASCAVTNVANSNAISINIVSNTPSITISTPVTDICVGDNVTFTATPINGGTAPSYQWKINNVNAGPNSVTFTPAVINNGDVFTCVMTSNEICLTSPTATSNAITMTVNPYVSPSITISTPSLITCAGDSIVFTAIATNGGPSPTYQWRLNGGNVGTNSPFYGNNTLATGDFIRCRVTSNANCLLNTNANSNILTMTVNPNSTPTISITSSITSGTTGVPITYNAVTNVPSPYTIKWIRNGSFVTYTPIPVWNTFMLSSSDTVEAWIIPETGCYDPDSVLSNRLFIKNVTSINHIEIEGLSLYPNPASRFVNIQGLLIGDEIRLVDMVGKTILVSQATNNESKEFNIHQLSNGIYFIRIQRDNKSQLFKLIKE